MTKHPEGQSRERPEPKTGSDALELNQETLTDLDSRTEADSVRGGRAANDSRGYTCTCDALG